MLLLAAAVAVVIGVIVATRSPAQTVMHTSAADSLRVRGNQLLYGPGRGRLVQLRGVNRSGSEYECLGPTTRYFDGPRPAEADSQAMIDEMLNWDINVVRLPLNEGCWLGYNNQPSDGGAYRAAIEAEVRKLNADHLFVILALQWNAPGGHYSDGPLPMADASHSPSFWRSVARTFRGDGLVIFDLYNEPHDISWTCWLRGCEVPVTKYNDYSYRAVGMQQLVDAVRSTHSTQPIIISGNDYGRDLSGIYANPVSDPDHSLIYALHTYGGESPCTGACLTTVLDAAQHFPVTYTEFGEVDCGDDYIDREMPILDRHHIGYLAWAWDATSPNGWNCSAGPALITNYGGTPTAYGAGFRAHLQSLGPPVRP